MINPKIAIITQFKDDAHILYEWCKYYINLGIDHIILINNESSDNFDIPIRELHSNKITLFHEKGNGIQIETYRKYYVKFRKLYDWFFFCDMDEFLYLNNPKLSIHTFLALHPRHIQAISIQWNIFIGQDFKQPKSVIENNIVMDLKAYSSKQFKSFIRNNFNPNNLFIHIPKIPQQKIKIYYPSQNIIQLNHYRTQSWEYLLGIKAGRGGGFSKFRWSDCNDKLLLEHKFCKYNTILRDRQNQLIEELHLRNQLVPQTTIYNNLVYQKTKDYLVKNNISFNNENNNLGEIIKYNLNMRTIVASINTKPYIL